MLFQSTILGRFTHNIIGRVVQYFHVPCLPLVTSRDCLSVCLFLSSALTIWLSLAHFDVVEDMAYPLPNNFNISFFPSYILRVSLGVVPLSKYYYKLFMKHYYIFSSFFSFCSCIQPTQLHDCPEEKEAWEKKDCLTR